MLSIFLNGLLTGFLYGMFSYGTIFFMLIKIGMQYGFRRGALFELGHILSLVLIILVIHFSLLQINQIIIFKKAFSLIGCLVLIGFGINTLRTADRAKPETVTKIPNHHFIFTGFLLNIINPFEFIIWFGILGTVNVNYNYTPNENLLFCIISLSFLAFFDLCKVFLAKQIGKNLTPKVMRIINICVGIILIGVGLGLGGLFLNLMKVININSNW